MKNIKLSIVILAVIALSAACFKIEKVSEIPHIEFISFEVFDTTDILQNKVKAGILKFKFEDGDGDIGVDKNAADTMNFKWSLYRKTGGTMQLVTGNDLLLPHSGYRIPYLNTVGQSKVLRGEIIIRIDYSFYKPEDIIKYSFFIIDRAGNHSNTEETAEIIISENGIYGKE